MVLQCQIRLVLFLNTDFYWTIYLIVHSFSVWLVTYPWAFIRIFVSFKSQIDNADSAGSFLFSFLIPQNQIMSFIFAWYLFYFILVQIDVNFTFCLISFFISLWFKQRLILLSANSPFLFIPIFLASNPWKFCKRVIKSIAVNYNG